MLELEGVLGWLKQAGIMLCCLLFLLGRVCVCVFFSNHVVNVRLFGLWMDG